MCNGSARALATTLNALIDKQIELKYAMYEIAIHDV
jgi:hypothetical protein